MRQNLIGGIVAVLVIIAAIVYFTRGSGTGAPAAETAFIAGMNPIMAQVQNPAGADYAGWRQKRAAMICQTVPNLAVAGWIGTVVKLDSTITGGTVFAVSVLPNVDFGTATSALTNLGSNTLISEDSPLYRTVGSLQVGEKVRFSGQLFNSSTDCIQEASVTESGSMLNPLFLTRFTAIAPLASSNP